MTCRFAPCAAALAAELAGTGHNTLPNTLPNTQPKRTPTRVPAMLALVGALLMGCGGSEQPVVTVMALPSTAASAPAGVDAALPTAAASAPAVVATTLPTPVLRSLPEYRIDRTQPSTVPGLPAPSAAELASIGDVSRSRAVAQLGRALLPRGNAVVVPPLTFAYAAVLASAARGDTLAQVQAQYPAELGAWASAAQTQGVQRQLWAPTATRFLPQFLAATDVAPGTPVPSLQSWLAAELSVWFDPLLAQALVALHPPMIDLDILDQSRPLFETDTRLLVADALNDRVRWLHALEFEGTFVTESGGTRMSMPMLQISAGVKRLTQPGFVADALTVGERTLLMIQPRADMLWQFSGAKLDAALAQATAALTGSARAALPDSRLVLPRVALKLPGQSVTSLGVALAFDEMHADLRGLDGGGTFLKARSAASTLTIDASGLALGAGHQVGFVFSPKNLFNPGAGGYGSVLQLASTNIVQFSNVVTCPNPDVDLRSFFLAVLDAQKRVISLSGIAALSGSVCQ